MTIQSIHGVEIRPIDAALGAEVHHLDATQRVHPDVVLALKRALLDHHVLVFKHQDLNEDQLKRFATSFGAIFQNPSDVPVLASAGDARGVAPDIVRVSNVDGYTGTGELSPHSDHRWTPYPSAGSLLYALEVPSSGGNTTFTNMNLVYETLEPHLKTQIAALDLITYNPFLRAPGDPRPLYRDPALPLISPVFPHPLVGTHPDSGKKILGLCAASEVEVVGVPLPRGLELVTQLRAHLTQARFAYAHRWSVGDVAYWDNRAVLHARDAFDPNERRVMKRISLAGGRPF